MADNERGKFTRALLGPEHPLEQEYGYTDAALIGAGRTLDTGWNGAKGGYYTALANLNNALGRGQAENDYRAKARAVADEQAQNDRHYQAMTQAYPFTTAFGEALPAVAGGLAVVPNAVVASVADRQLEQYARALGVDPRNMTLRGAGAQAFQSFPTLKGLLSPD